MSNNGGFPPLKQINKDKKEIPKTKDRLFSNKIVDINKIIKEIKNPMIDMNKEEIKIIDTL